MSRIKDAFHDEIERRAMTPEEIRELAYELEIQEKDNYYQQHPEEMTNANNRKQ